MLNMAGYYIKPRMLPTLKYFQAGAVVESAARRTNQMSLTRFFVVSGAVGLAASLALAAQRTQSQPSITFGMAKVSLGMTVDQVQESLSGAARHIEFLPDKQTSIVRRNGDDDTEGQVNFSGGQAIYAQYQMPNAHTADELAQEIAGAVDNMETKTCEASNYSAHGTGGGFSQSIFDCGSRRFNVMTMQILGSSVRSINVNIEIGQPVAK
jgi:hypothetical protein